MFGKLFAPTARVSAAAAAYEDEALKLKTLAVKKKREALERAYEAAESSQYWPRRGDARSGNSAMDRAHATLRSWSRFLDENHDLVVSILDDLEKKIIGCGTQVVPMAKSLSGELHPKFNDEAKKLWDRWTRSRPDTTRTFSWTQLENLVVRSWLRDGEIIIHHVEGAAPISHRSSVPYSIEVIEADYLPFDLQRASTPAQNRIVHGVELTDWREPVAYYLTREHPGDAMMVSSSLANITRDYKRVSSDKITHLKFTRRVSQVRGVPIFHAVLRRLEDIKEYEESERIAARVAAAMCAVITKTTDFQGAENLNADGNRIMEFNPGMIFDNMNPGEKVEMVGSDRPNPNLKAFVDSQIRRVAGGTGTSFSGIAKDFNGTYSAQRQELVESWTQYEKLREYYYDGFLRPVYQRFIRMAIASGQLKSTGVDEGSLFDVDLVGVSMPWIDPLKEAEANRVEIETGITSRHMVIREKQLDPKMVDAQILSDPLRELLMQAPKPGRPVAVDPPAATNALRQIN